MELYSHISFDRTTEANDYYEVHTVIPQSGETFTVTTGTKETASENVEFMDSNPAFNYTVDSTDDPTRGIADVGDASLGTFLSRPILIKEFEWATSTSFFEQFDPWSLFYNNARNINRIANFNLLRSKLCVRILVNGNGFYYGRLIASYNPIPAEDEVTVNRGLNITQDVVGASQRPHIYINPTECQGGDLCLPFVWPQNALSIPKAQWSKMGQMTISSLNPLRNANGATDPITISVFAYAEDVNLSIPTASNPVTITPQSDEYGNTPVANMASRIARVTGKLGEVPYIGPFAMATTMAAKAVGGIAQLFGFSRPAIIDTVSIYKPQYVGGLANTNTPDTTNKLSLDVKQEVTIDPSVVGVGSTDEMGLVDIAKRESYYTTFTWQPVGGARSGPGFKLFQTQVIPTVYRTFGSGAGTEFHLTPSGYASLPFSFWGGSMEFRIQVVASNFHRGRLRLVWDPSSLTGDDYNTAYTKVVDISDMRDFTFKIGWGREASFLPVYNPMSIDVGTGTTVPSFTLGDSDPAMTEVYGNGTLSVFVVNDLTVPNTDAGIDSDVEINVFTKMCDDARFAQPDDKALSSITYFNATAPSAQSKVATVEAQSDEVEKVDMKDQEAAPVSEQPDTMCAADQPVTDHMMDVYFGEQVTSIRQMMKRYCLHSLNSVGLELSNQALGTNTSTRMPDFPYYFGYNANGVNETAAGDKFSYCYTTLMNYFAPAYVAYRGGIRWKHLIQLSQNDPQTDQNLNDSWISSTRTSGFNKTLGGAPTYTPYKRNETTIIGATTGANANDKLAASAVDSTGGTVSGAYVTPQRENPDCEIELPFYNQRRFMSARRIDNVSQRFPNPDFADVEFPPCHNVQANGPVGVMYNYVATAEDFSLNFFIGVPIMYSLGVFSPNGLPAAA